MRYVAGLFRVQPSVGWNSALEKLGVTEEDQEKFDKGLQQQEMSFFNSPLECYKI